MYILYFFIKLFTKRQNFIPVQIETIFRRQKTNVKEELKLGLGREKNIVGKGENAGYQHFLLFPQYFQKSGLCCKELLNK